MTDLYVDFPLSSEKGRLSADDIERMVREAEEFADEDAAIRKKIEGLNSLQNTIFSAESSVKDTEGLGGKISSEDKKTILDAVAEKKEWLEANGQDASAEDFEDQLSEFQSIVQPIFAGTYGSASGGQETYGSHDEL
jgi:heat shock protein 5